jgi:hypothetical protein
MDEREGSGGSRHEGPFTIVGAIAAIVATVLALLGVLRAEYRPVVAYLLLGIGIGGFTTWALYVRRPHRVATPTVPMILPVIAFLCGVAVLFGPQFIVPPGTQPGSGAVPPRVSSPLPATTVPTPAPPTADSTATASPSSPVPSPSPSIVPGVIASVAQILPDGIGNDVVVLQVQNDSAGAVHVKYDPASITIADDAGNNYIVWVQGSQGADVTMDPGSSFMRNIQMPQGVALARTARKVYVTVTFSTDAGNVVVRIPHVLNCGLDRAGSCIP